MGAGLSVTLLGTGSPRPSLSRSQPAALVRWGNSQVLVDCGDGTVRQLQRAGISPGGIEKVLFTHLHWDHILGYPGLVWGGWSLGRTSLDVWGPGGTKHMHEELVRSFYDDQAQWVQGIGYGAAGWDDISVSELADGDELEVEGCTISAHHVLHPPVEAFAYRFEYEGRSLVVSGDVAYCEELIAASRNADLIVVDVCATAPESGSPFPEQMMKNLRVSHASAGDAAVMATKAGVARMICTHLLPGVESSTVVDQARAHFDGQIEVGEDLQTYSV